MGTTSKSRKNSFLVRFLSYIRSWMSYVILKYILGWQIKRDTKAYTPYKNGRYVAVYLHTSLHDHIISTLFSYAYNLPFIMIGAKRSKRDTQKAGISYILYNVYDMIVVDPKKDNKTTCESIVKKLLKRRSFTFLINPEGSIHRTTRLKSGFYQIAKTTKSSILLFDLNYNTHEVDLREIVPRMVVKTASYERICELVTDELCKTLPFDARKTFLQNKVHMNTDDEDIGDSSINVNKTKTNAQSLVESSDQNLFADSSQISKVSNPENIGKPTSLVNLNNSILRYAPVAAVIGIVISISLKVLL